MSAAVFIKLTEEWMAMRIPLLIIAVFLVFGCLAQPQEGEITGPTNVSFTAEEGKCGSSVQPQGEYMEGGVFLEGSIGASNPCYFANSTFSMNESGIILDIDTTKQDVESCEKCFGTIPWKASIFGYSGKVYVYYNNKRVYPKEGFCGWETQGSCKTDFDCTTGGCSGQVCESVHENPAITTCEYNECYDAKAYGARCGCVQGLCQWS
jgi:eight-cysteine-cluster-containing protein